MKTFKQFMVEKFGPTWETYLPNINENHISIHNGVKLFPTNHAQQRELERHVPRDSLKHIHKKVVDKIHSGEYNPPHGSFMVFDKEHKQTVVMDYRHDKYAKHDNTKHLFIVSAYPPGAKGNPRKDQKNIVTEQLEI